MRGPLNHPRFQKGLHDISTCLPDILICSDCYAFARFGRALRLPKKEAAGMARLSKRERRYEAGRKRKWKEG